jgi:UrcA family protein
MRILRMTVAAAGIFLAAAEGRAQVAPVVIEGSLPTARVSYADLDLTSPAGRLTLDRRVSRAASVLCLDNQRAPLDEFMAQRHCYSTAMSKARIDIEQAVNRAGTRFASQATILVAAK